MSKYSIQTYTIIDGWQNLLCCDHEPQLFDTYEQARSDLHEIFYDQACDFAIGQRDDIDNPDDYRIIKEGVYQ